MTGQPRVVVRIYRNEELAGQRWWYWVCNACRYQRGSCTLVPSDAHDSGREHARECHALRYALLVARLEAEATEALARAGVWNRASENAQQLGTAMRLSAMAYATTGMVSRLHAIISEATR